MRQNVPSFLNMTRKNDWCTFSIHTYMSDNHLPPSFLPQHLSMGKKLISSFLYTCSNGEYRLFPPSHTCLPGTNMIPPLHTPVYSKEKSKVISSFNTPASDSKQGSVKTKNTAWDKLLRHVLLLVLILPPHPCSFSLSDHHSSAL